MIASSKMAVFPLPVGAAITKCLSNVNTRKQRELNYTVERFVLGSNLVFFLVRTGKYKFASKKKLKDFFLEFNIILHNYYSVT